MAVRMVKFTPTITAGAYTDGDCVGGVIQIKDAPIAGTIQSLIIQDDSDTGMGLQLFFFDSEPVGVADNAAYLTIPDADANKIMGYLAEDTWIDNVDNQFAWHNNISMAYEGAGDGLWLIIRVNDASPPTFAATDDLKLHIGIVY